MEDSIQAIVDERKTNALCAIKNAAPKFSVNPNDYKMLAKYGIDPTDQVEIHGILKDLVRLQHNVQAKDNFNVFVMKAGNSKICQLVKVPLLTSWKQF